MRQRPWFLFGSIIFVTLFLLLVNLPKEIHTSFRFPGRSEELKIDQKIHPVDVEGLLKSIGIKRNLSLRRGLDLEGGTSVTLRAEMKGVEKSQRETALESAKNVIERRINFFGVSEPVVQTSKVNDDYRILVEIPGVTDVKQAVDLIGQTAQLEFRGVKDASPSAFFIYEQTNPTGLSGSDLQSAQPSFDPNNGEPVVLFTVASKSRDKFFKETQKLIGKPMAIFLDRQFVSAPIVQQAIRDNGQITGGFTIQQARQLSTQLNAGALPISLKVLSQNAIGATLGKESLEKSFIAGILGFVIIVAFMSILYGRLGVIASLALIVYTLLVMTVFRILPVTLTLAGIAGFILSIGIAVDANILIFERMREEIRLGKTFDQAFRLGSSRAWPSIRDSNIASLITSFILYWFGTGMIRGFALTLAIGVLISMFSAIVVSKTFIQILYRPKAKELL